MRASAIAAPRSSRPVETSRKPSASCERKDRPRPQRKPCAKHRKGLWAATSMPGGRLARTEAFQQLCHDIAMHVAALDPRYVRREEVTAEMLEKEREIYRAQALATGKPENVVDKIVNGKMEKFYEENCLYEQHYIKDESVTIGEMIANAIAKLGENISISRFVRFKVGEVSASGNGPDTADRGRTQQSVPVRGALFVCVGIALCGGRDSLLQFRGF